MMDSKNRIFLLLVSALAFGILGMACTEDLDDCDPTVDEGCVCTLDDDGVTEVDDCIDGSTDDGEACTCTLDDGGNVNPDPQPDGQPDGNPDAEPEAPVFRFVMVQDEVANPSGDFPGSDTDAVSIVKASGAEVFATDIEAETDIDCTGNLACDTNSILGAPDAIDPATGVCFGGGAPDGSQFLALNGGRVVLSFGTETIENGDSIHVYEVGAAECGRFDDDAFSVSVSTTDDFTGDVVNLGTAGNGNNVVDVSGL